MYCRNAYDPLEGIETIVQFYPSLINHLCRNAYDPLEGIETLG